MRNLTWETDFRNVVPYKKGDTLEYMWIFSGDSGKKLLLDLSSIEALLDIERIELDEKEIARKTLLDIETKNSSLLKITGKAKAPNANDTTPELDIVTQEDLVKEVPKEEEKTVELPGIVPGDITIDTTKYSSNINNLLVFRGKNLDIIDFVNIGEKRIRPVYLSGELLVQVDRDTFTTGEYFVFFTQKNGKILTSEHRISFEHSSLPINIASITPRTIQNSENTFVVIQGNGFDKIISIQLSNNLILKNAEFKIINPQVAGVKIPKDLPPGEYYFNIMDTRSIYELKNMRFTITHP